MYKFVPASNIEESMSNENKILDKIIDSKNSNSVVPKKTFDSNHYDAPIKLTKKSYCDNSGFEDLVESDVNDKNGLLSDTSDSSSPVSGQTDDDRPIDGTCERETNNHDDATDSKDVRKEVNKRTNCKNKKVRINENITSIPDRYDNRVNNRSGYNGYKQEDYRSKNKKDYNIRNNKTKYYYWYCYDTHNSDRRLTTWREEQDKLIYYLR